MADPNKKLLSGTANIDRRGLFTAAPPGPIKERGWRIGLFCAAIGAASLLAAALPEGIAAGTMAVQAAASQATVSIRNFAFAPATLTVAAGTTVTWKNEDDSRHRLVDRNGKFGSATLDSDQTFSYNFATPGDYAYFCSIHPYMVGKIMVRAGAEPSPN